jgi:hypothetical protein
MPRARAGRGRSRSAPGPDFAATTMVVLPQLKLESLSPMECNPSVEGTSGGDGASPLS